MSPRKTDTAPARLLALFVLLSGVPLAALGWLGWHVLQQDRALERQRQRERLDNAASLVARDLDRVLTTWEDLLPAAARGEAVVLPAGATVLVIGADGVAEQRGTPLSYYPRVPEPARPASATFAAAEASEFRDGDLKAAIAAYRTLAASPDASIRADALVRLARCQRKQQRPDEALIAYSALARLGGVPAAGAPAELVARRERIALLSAAGETQARDEERALLTAALADGRFRIDRATFEYFRDAAPDVRADPRAAAADALWPVWTAQAAGRRTWTGDGVALVSVWRQTPAGVAAMIVDVDAAARAMRESLVTLHVAARFENDAGAAIWGTTAAGGSTSTDAEVTRPPRETGLPWTLRVAASDASAGAQIAASRRNLFAAGFGLMALVIAAAGYVVFRAVTRELGVARLQSDFVAAVSHEFRTPLTAMCHLTEMLEEGDANPARLPEYYRALGRESRRLHTMVENLLDFGRLDSGRRVYEFEETDAVALVDRVVQEYADRSPAAARRIEKALPAPALDGVTIRADREALALAIRNLLDNAMKYSPESAPVTVAVARQDGGVALSVADRGAGISGEERRVIFQKFTRGAAARTLNVKGTGIGLTMADQIVKAHGGRLELESEPGRGSTFTIRLRSLKAEV